MKDSTKQQLENALTRLRDGEPVNPKLRAILDSKLGAGKTYHLISIANVALEAGVSRTLIGYDGCQYPAIRMAVLKAKKAAPSSSIIKSLRQEIAELRRQKAELITVIASQRADLDRVHKSLIELGADPTVRSLRKNFRNRQAKQ
ncbi:hypothetical protein [Xanthomonas campestris]|uniref:hypothetical protein n=1 Tax=Xanthomonas campestris TaxID=339 RepID=UPI0012FD4288|nr:hypothetical protein [Xanthomonas campestris]